MVLRGYRRQGGGAIVDPGASWEVGFSRICGKGRRRGRRAQELIATSGALTLVTNCVMAWNTQRLQRAVDREAERTAPRFSIEALRPIGPVGVPLISVSKVPVLSLDNSSV